MHRHTEIYLALFGEISAVESGTRRSQHFNRGTLSGLSFTFLSSEHLFEAIQSLLFLCFLSIARYNK